MAKQDEKVAKKYAKALFELCDQASLESMQGALDEVVHVWKNSGDLRIALVNPGIPVQEKIQVVQEIASKIKNGDKIFANLLSTMVSNKRMQMLPDIALEFSGLVNALKKILTLKITSAFALPGDEQEATTKNIQQNFGSLANISWEVDPEILGGLLIQTGDKLVDASVKGSLERMREDLVLG